MVIWVTPCCDGDHPARGQEARSQAQMRRVRGYAVEAVFVLAGAKRRARLGRPRAIRINEQKGVTRICATTLKPPSNPSIVTEDGLVRSDPMHLDNDPSRSRCGGSAFCRARRSVVWVGWARMLSAPGLRAWGTAGASTSVRHGQTFSNERAADVPTVNEQRAAEPPKIALIRTLCPGPAGTGHALKFN